MTKQKSFKGRVRTRMAKTGESYSAARRVLITRAGTETVGDEAVDARTGRGRAEWFALIDAWGGRTRPHREIAAWLVDEHGVDGWWAQNITVAYEQARGLRVPGQKSDGTFGTSVSRTVAADPVAASRAFTDPDLLARWFPEAELTVTTAREGKSVRARWGAGPERVVVAFTEKSPGRTQIAVGLERLAGLEAVAQWKVAWRERMDALRDLLES